MKRREKENLSRTTITHSFFKSRFRALAQAGNIDGCCTNAAQVTRQTKEHPKLKLFLSASCFSLPHNQTMDARPRYSKALIPNSWTSQLPWPKDIIKRLGHMSFPIRWPSTISIDWSKGRNIPVLPETLSPEFPGTNGNVKEEASSTAGALLDKKVAKNTNLDISIALWSFDDATVSPTSKIFKAFHFSLIFLLIISPPALFRLKLT